MSRRTRSTEPSDPVSPPLVPLPTDRLEDIIEEPRGSVEREGSVDLTPNLAEAITLMTQAFRSRDGTPAKRAKAKEPNTFDGSDSRKLNNFILLCNLYFRTNPSYSDDTTKVTFALSYL